MSDEDTFVEDIDAPELIAVLHGIRYRVAQAMALATPEARRDLALYGTTHHEVTGYRWVHVPREKVAGWRS